MRATLAADGRARSYRCGRMATDVQHDPVTELPDAIRPDSTDSSGRTRSARTLLLVALAAAAGVLHAKAMVDHAGHYWLFGVFFGVLTYAQVLWAMALYRRPDDKRLLMPAALASLAVVGVWLVSRTVGLPIGPWAWDAEPIGSADLAATLDELALALVIFAILRPDRRIAARLAWLDDANCMRVGMMFCAFSLFALALGSHGHPTVR